MLYESSDSSSPRKAPFMTSAEIGIFHVAIADLGEDLS